MVTTNLNKLRAATKNSPADRPARFNSSKETSRYFRATQNERSQRSMLQRRSHRNGAKSLSRNYY